jgi:hypothetical protein
MGRSILALSAMVAAACMIQSPAVSQPADDHLIAPNERAGRLRLGMPAAEVLSTFGQPQDSGFLGSGEGYITYFDGVGTGNDHLFLSAMTWGPRNEVFQINVYHTATRYATREGVTFGMPELNVRLLIGQPVQRIWDEGRWVLYYQGQVIYLNGAGQVDKIALCLPRYQHRGQAGRRWCY